MVLKEGEIPHSWREAIISVIPKEGKDKQECSSYKPISILNQNYRLFTAILARRLEIILPERPDEFYKTQTDARQYQAHPTCNATCNQKSDK